MRYSWCNSCIFYVTIYKFGVAGPRIISKQNRHFNRNVTIHLPGWPSPTDSDVNRKTEPSSMS